MTKRKITSVLLTLAILFSAMSFSAHAVGTSAEAAHLEELATTYVENFVNTIYLYESPDLAEGTLKEHYSISENLTATQMTASMNAETVDLCGTTRTAAELCENLSIVETTAEYLKYIRSEQNITRTNFNMDVSIISTHVEEDSAYVHLYTYITYYYTGDPEQAAAGDNYVVYFTKLDGDWVIADVCAEEIEVGGYEDILSTYSTRIQQFDLLETVKSMAEEAATESINAVEQPVVEPNAITTAYDRTYNATAAVAYAYTYTTSTYTADNGNNGDFLNGNFIDCSDLLGNCQNFVSQCLWAGLGGNDELSAVTQTQFPMNSSWYIEQDGTHSGSWTATDPFRAYIKGANAELIASYNEIDVSVTPSFAGYTITQLIGSVLHVTPSAESLLGHAIIITSANGTSFSTVKYCGNSPMRKAWKLSESGYTSNDMVLIIPQKMMRGRTCGGGGVHTFSGSSCTCTKSGCGFVKLEVQGTPIIPVAKGTTYTISGTANATCYRMAIGIKAPSKQETWREALSTSSISLSYTFNETGLYTIVISGRDISPDNSNSAADTHVYKIRVY